jgi:hypothetical protein
MIKRIVYYAVLLVLALTAAIWFAFGPGVAKPLLVLLWPAEWLAYHLNPAAGSNPRVDLLSTAFVAWLVWLAAAVLLDVGVAQASRKMHHGG